MKEKTLKIEIATPQGSDPAPLPPKMEWWRGWHKILAVPLVASLASALIVGRKVEPNFPQEALLPKVSSAPARPEKTPPRPVVSPAGSKNLFVRCRMELQRPKRSLSMLENFPACQQAFLSDQTCGELARDYAEILYLQAYGLAVSIPQDARRMLLRAEDVLAHCPVQLPLRKRALELLRKLAEGSLPKNG